MVKNLLLFASGSGSNAINVCQHFKNNPNVTIKGLICNNPKAGVIEKMKDFGVPVIMVNRADFNNPEIILPILFRFEPSLICLLGFLWKIPEYMVSEFPNRILNLHPALLPKFGGKGMYGMRVHEAVKLAGEVKSGISIHWVNEAFDEGEIIEQFSIDITAKDSAEDISNKIHALEQKHVPIVIEKVLDKMLE